MAITAEQIQRARESQGRAAHDDRPQVRLIAGPGTGNSFTIEDRVCWLLENGTDPRRIFAISFTNASAGDLRQRIVQFCASRNQDGTPVSVTTMRSLALRMLRVAGLLEQFPAAPMVIDQWELKNVFTSEFREAHACSKKRADFIRRDREAFWSTGVFDPPNYIPPRPPIEEAARLLYVSITRARAACVLSFARGRVVHGRFVPHASSRFNNATGGAYAAQVDGLAPALAARIVADCALL